MTCIHGNEYEDEQLAESRHFNTVCKAFVNYAELANLEVDRIEKNLLRLKPWEQELLDTPVLIQIQKIRDAVQSNQGFLELLVGQDLNLADEDDEICTNDRDAAVVESDEVHSQLKTETTHGHCQADETRLGETECAEMTRDPKSKQRTLHKRMKSWNQNCLCDDSSGMASNIEDNEVSSMNVFKVRSVLKQFAREWSSEVRDFPPIYIFPERRRTKCLVRTPVECNAKIFPIERLHEISWPPTMVSRQNISDIDLPGFCVLGLD